MQGDYKQALAGLNRAQRQAVETIYGPVLVIAGPGTGKTQLIGTRAGYILENTDASPADILCLTFTNSGVDEMRQRLIKLVGQEAYNINIYTYHAFGGEVLRRFPEYFDDEQLEPIEDLRRDMLLREIIARLPYDSPLKYADAYSGDVAAFIKEVKQALLKPDDIQQIAQANLATIDKLNKELGAIFSQFTVVNKQSLRWFERLHKILGDTIQSTELPGRVSPLGAVMTEELGAALKAAKDISKTSSLTEWKRHWLEKDTRGNFILSGRRQNERLAAAAGIYVHYEEALARQHLYDYEDMILRSIAALEANPDLKYSLAEQFQFIMLDEFQDTNAAQFKLVELLTDHPSLEGKPNVLAVGDDDQAIYAFQGADHANMARFAKEYRDVAVINLTENYRAAPELISLAEAVSGQIGQRLHHDINGIDKKLSAAGNPKLGHINLREFKSDAAEYAWIAKEASRLVASGGAANEIAILSPKHRFLEAITPFLAAESVPVYYERREDILDTPLVRQLVQMSRLVLALADQNETLADELWPEILSYDFWQLPTDLIWRLGWSARQERQPWTGQLLKTPETKNIAQFFLSLQAQAGLQPLELILDGLLGVPEATRALGLKHGSPIYGHLLAVRRAKQQPLAYTELVNNLSILRSRLRDWGHGGDSPLDLRAFVEFVEGHRAAGLNILNESPYHQTDNAVNLVTAYGSKGREFAAVFLVGCNDDIWGSASRRQTQRIGLPANLNFIRYQGASEDERLRLLFVAATRAKTHLYLTSHRQTLAGKKTERLKYLDIVETDSGAKARTLPDNFAGVIDDQSEALAPETVELYWTDRHLPPFKPTLKSVLAPQLARYQLSATDLNRFIDLERGGPDAFFLKSILGFPEAPTQTAIYGTAIHDTLKWLGGQLKTTGKLPTEKQALDYFKRLLTARRLPAEQMELLANKGQSSLSEWFKSRAKQLSANDFYEFNFRDEGVFVGKAHLGGKVDRLIVNKPERTIQVVDYKTGQPFAKWSSQLKLHKFRQQLMFYKLLVEGSAKFRGYKVESGFIEFIEAQEGQVVLLELKYDEQELADFKRLIESVWQHVQKLDFPDVSKYPPTLTGVRKFEADLIGN